MESDILLIDGFSVDVVSRVLDPEKVHQAWNVAVDEEDSQDTRPLLSIFHELQTSATVYESKESSMRAVEAAVVAGMAHEQIGTVRRIEEVQDIYNADLRAFIEYLVDDRGRCSAECLPLRRHDGCWKQYQHQAKHMLFGRTYITTSRGYVGLAPKNVEERCYLHPLRWQGPLRSPAEGQVLSLHGILLRSRHYGRGGYQHACKRSIREDDI